MLWSCKVRCGQYATAPTTVVLSGSTTPASPRRRSPRWHQAPVPVQWLEPRPREFFIGVRCARHYVCHARGGQTRSWQTTVYGGGSGITSSSSPLISPWRTRAIVNRWRRRPASLSIAAANHVCLHRWVIQQASRSSSTMCMVGMRLSLAEGMCAACLDRAWASRGRASCWPDPTGPMGGEPAQTNRSQRFGNSDGFESLDRLGLGLMGKCDHRVSGSVLARMR